MIQLHETFVDPRDVAWIWFSTVMKSSWASCCAYPANSEEALHVVTMNEVGPYGADSPEYISEKSLSNSQQVQSVGFLHAARSCLPLRK